MTFKVYVSVMYLKMVPMKPALHFSSIKKCAILHLWYSRSKHTNTYPSRIIIVNHNNLTYKSFSTFRIHCFLNCDQFMIRITSCLFVRNKCFSIPDIHKYLCVYFLTSLCIELQHASMSFLHHTCVFIMIRHALLHV